jgi:DNA-binding transcriptional ArsR family regulator
MFKNLWLFDKQKLLILKNLESCKNSYAGCDLIEILNIKKSLLSYHLKILENQGLIKSKKIGRKKFYRLNPAKKKFIKQVLQVVN